MGLIIVSCRKKRNYYYFIMVISLFFMCFFISLFVWASDNQSSVKIEINTYARTLTLYKEGEIYKTYPIAIGKPSTRTPIGEWAVVNKSKNWGGALGTRWLGLNVPWGSYGIHGTDRPQSIGTAASHGCIRMHNQHVEELYELVPLKTRVKIIGQRLAISVNRILYPGAKGLDVMQLQDNLKQAGFEPSYMDARFGPETEKAVKELKAYYGLKIDGIADPNVLYLLDLPEKGKEIDWGLY